MACIIRNQHPPGDPTIRTVKDGGVAAHPVPVASQVKVGGEAEAGSAHGADVLVVVGPLVGVSIGAEALIRPAVLIAVVREVDIAEDGTVATGPGGDVEAAVDGAAIRVGIREVVGWTAFGTPPPNEVATAIQLRGISVVDDEVVVARVIGYIAKAWDAGGCGIILTARGAFSNPISR